MSIVKRRIFPESFKREAVDRVATSGLSAGAVAKELGLHETVLRRWMMQFGTQATVLARSRTSGTGCEAWVCGASPALAAAP